MQPSIPFLSQPWRNSPSARAESRFTPVAGLVDDAEARASVADAAFARHVEQLGRVGLVAQDVLSFLELRRELVACGDVPGVAGAAEAFGLHVPRLAAEE